MTRRTLPVVLLALIALVAGCSTVPSSSATVQITQAPSRPDADVGIEPLEPEIGATPEEIVRGFLDAAASAVRRHPVARQHLTPEAAESWSDETGITVLGADYATVTIDAGTVAVTADLIGTVDPRGVFTVGGQAVYTTEFTLQQVDGEWRITNPPDGLLMFEPDFERLYEQRAVYFVDPSGQRVVPDPRYVITGESQPTALVERLLAGPSASLSAGVRNALAGLALRRAVTASASTISVDLTGVGGLPPNQLSELSAQLVWTLDQLAVPTVEVLVDGEPLALEGVPAQQTVDDWSSFDPEAAPVGAVGHYLDNGALRTVDGQPAPGPAGTGGYGLTSAAVSADVRTGELTSMVGTATVDGQAALLAGPYGGDLAPVITGAGSLSVPTVAATRAEFWVVRDGAAVVRVPSGGGTPQAVTAPTLEGLGRATVLQLSPDGVRAAVVVEAQGEAGLYVGTVVRSEEGPVALRDLRDVAPTLSQVADVAWESADRLLVLAGDASEDRIVPYEVGVDGWGLTPVPTSGLPGQPTAIAAAPGQPPLVSSDRTIWQQVGGTWVTLIRGQQPLPGTEPLYPA
ncbi:LpqB family beta-propeller domain-containing protein [Blastococcus sp. SYSU D00820]